MWLRGRRPDRIYGYCWIHPGSPDETHPRLDVSGRGSTSSYGRASSSVDRRTEGDHVSSRNISGEDPRPASLPWNPARDTENVIVLLDPRGRHEGPYIGMLRHSTILRHTYDQEQRNTDGESIRNDGNGGRHVIHRGRSIRADFIHRRCFRN